MAQRLRVLAAFSETGVQFPPHTSGGSKLLVILTAGTSPLSLGSAGMCTQAQNQSKSLEMEIMWVICENDTT